MIQEFRDFINRGNLVDIAVAFVMGVAFAAVITSLIVNFLIVGTFVMFFVVKAYNRMKRADEADDEPSEDILLLREIRDGINSQ